MTSDTMVVRPKCMNLVDQGRYIGSDPVGHVCFKDAAYQIDGRPLCEDCFQILKKNSRGASPSIAPRRRPVAPPIGLRIAIYLARALVLGVFLPVMVMGFICFLFVEGLTALACLGTKSVD